MFRTLAAAGAMLGVWQGFGQSPPAAPRLEFEAVSIKPNKSGEFGESIHPAPGGRFTATNITTKLLIEWAYEVRSFQVSGEPAWVDSERYDVAAKADGNPHYDFLQPTLETMFRAVLADRFKLVAHTVKKELPVYLLVVLKSGPKIRAVDEGDCPEVPTPENPCRSLRSKAFGQLGAEKAPMPALARILINFVGRSVLDRTNLPGSFTYTLDWKKYLDPPQMPPGVVPPPNAFDPASVEPAIATALEEQLGLKLESQKGPVEVMVIDHIDRPSEN
jgi:uncharacterized protein (TIGR03435 family)